MQIAQDEQPADQRKEGKRGVPGKAKARRPVATTAGPWWQPRPSRGGASSPRVVSVFCDASISHAFIARFLLAFAFKWGMNVVHIILCA